jgi:hypothetical protein
LIFKKIFPLNICKICIYFPRGLFCPFWVSFFMDIYSEPLCHAGVAF